MDSFFSFGSTGIGSKQLILHGIANRLLLL